MTEFGKLTSTPDANGNHKLRCPKCHTTFLAPITKDDDTGEIENTVCENCHHTDEPLKFVYAANKEQADKMVMGYAEREMKNMLKKTFRGSKNIRIK
ncbi:hypothetical protein KC952_03275 [Candidatus Saccharibacteria bacterium]|nr:hypothetical protein [Candidatus Saccharibacteria bacterium]